MSPDWDNALRVAGVRVVLTHKEFQILRVLRAKFGVWVRRDVIERCAETTSVPELINKIRHKLAGSVLRIYTERNQGYRLSFHRGT